MQNGDRVDFKALLEPLLRHYGKTPSKHLLKAYWRVLKPLGLPHLETTIERIYASGSRGLPSAYDILAKAKGSTGDGETTVHNYAAPQQRLRELAAVKARINGTEQPPGPPVRLLAIRTGRPRGYVPVEELSAEDARFWLSKFEREQQQDAEGHVHPPDHGRATAVRTALRGSGG